MYHLHLLVCAKSSLVWILSFVQVYGTYKGPGWDFYGHPGILDDTKSSDFTRNICQNQRTWLQNVKPQQEISYQKKKGAKSL